MQKNEIVEIIRNSKREMKTRYGVEKMGIFGSYARGNAKRKSDIDILVSFNRDIDLFEFVDLKEYLQNKLNRSVDLVMESALKPAIRKTILSTVEYV